MQRLYFKVINQTVEKTESGNQEWTPQRHGKNWAYSKRRRQTEKKNTTQKLKRFVFYISKIMVLL
jgi:hypothetical protein